MPCRVERAGSDRREAGAAKSAWFGRGSRGEEAAATGREPTLGIRRFRFGVGKFKAEELKTAMKKLGKHAGNTHLVIKIILVDFLFHPRHRTWLCEELEKRSIPYRATARFKALSFCLAFSAIWVLGLVLQVQHQSVSI